MAIGPTAEIRAATALRHSAGQIHDGKVVESPTHVGMVRIKRLFEDRQRALVQPLRLAVLALRRPESSRATDVFVG
jgi:hypothetical protein